MEATSSTTHTRAFLIFYNNFFKVVDKPSQNTATAVEAEQSVISFPETRMSNASKYAIRDTERLRHKGIGFLSHICIYLSPTNSVL